MRYSQEVIRCSRLLAEKAGQAHIPFFEEGVHLLYGTDTTLYIVDVTSLVGSEGSLLLLELFRMIFPGSNRTLYLDEQQVKRLHTIAAGDTEEASRAMAALRTLRALQRDRPESIVDLNASSGRAEDLMAASRRILNRAAKEGRSVVVCTVNRTLGAYANELKLFGSYHQITVVFPQKGGFVRENTALPSLKPMVVGSSAPVQLLEEAPQAPFYLEGSSVPLQPGKKLGGGAESTVYRADDRPGQVYKIFSYTFQSNDLYSEKLRRIARIGAHAVSEDLCIPNGVLVDARGRVCGVSMREIENCVVLEDLFADLELTKQVFPDRASIVQLATDVFIAVYRLCYNGIYPFDLKLSNIFLNTSTRQIVLFDIDSCQMDRYPGLTFSADNTAPDAAAVDLSHTLRNAEDLKYTIYAIIFQILHLGRNHLAPDNSFIFADDNPPESLSSEFFIFKNLIYATQGLFRRALSVREGNKELRPSLAELYNALSREACRLRAESDPNVLKLFPSYIRPSRTTGVCSCCGKERPINHLVRFGDGILLCDDCKSSVLPMRCECGNSLNVTLGNLLTVIRSGESLPRYCPSCQLSKRYQGASREELLRPVSENDFSALPNAIAIKLRHQPKPAPVPEAKSVPKEEAQTRIRTAPRYSPRQKKPTLMQRIRDFLGL